MRQSPLIRSTLERGGILPELKRDRYFQARYTCNFAIGTSSTFGSEVVQVEYLKREPRTNSQWCT